MEKLPVYIGLVVLRYITHPSASSTSALSQLLSMFDTTMVEQNAIDKIVHGEVLPLDWSHKVSFNIYNT